MEATGSWPRALHGEKVQHLYPSPNIISVIKSRRIQVDKMGKPSGTYGKYDKHTHGFGGRNVKERHF